MKFTAQQIAVQLEGTVDGDPNAEVYQLSKIEDAQKGSLTFLSNPKYTPFIYKTKASVTIVNDDFIAESHLKTTLVRVNNAYDSFTVLLDYYNKVKVGKKGIAKSAEIDESVILGKDCYVGSMTCIESDLRCLADTTAVVGIHSDYIGHCTVPRIVHYCRVHYLGL